jgi:protoporphyrinogen oxidase
MLPSKIDTKFLYPAQGGFGGFYEKLLVLCRAHEGFDVIVNDQIAGLTDSGQHLDAITRNNTNFSFGELIWTGNLNDLCQLASSDHTLSYLNTIFYNLICRDEGIGRKTAQWIYVSKGDSLISRITCMKEFAPYTCREGYYNFICELTDSQASPRYFQDPAKYRDGILDELMQMSFLKDKKYVEDIKINPVLDTYPIYHKQYIRDFAQAVKTIRKFSGRIHLLGRCGAFWYNNSDHSIRFAIEMANKLLKKSSSDFDYRTYFGGTYGRAADPQGR